MPGPPHYLSVGASVTEGRDAGVANQHASECPTRPGLTGRFSGRGLWDTSDLGERAFVGTTEGVPVIDPFTGLGVDRKGLDWSLRLVVG